MKQYLISYNAPGVSGERNEKASNGAKAFEKVKTYLIKKHKLISSDIKLKLVSAEELDELDTFSKRNKK